MITIAVTNVLESSEQAMRLIQELSQKRGIRTLSISPKNKIIYMNSKKVRLKEYIDSIKISKDIDLLLMDLSRCALEKQIYQNINFDIAVLFDSKTTDKKVSYHRSYLTHRLMKSIQSDFYIVPDTYKSEQGKYITYGWSKKAHISASSAQKNLEGDTNLQCCIQNYMPSFKGNISIPREFCIHSQLDDVEGMLAGIATMLLYGINLE